MDSKTGNGDHNADLKFLVLGGCGFIGRHVVSYLLDKCSTVFVIDKSSPEVAWLSPEHQAAMKNPKVKFISANLITLQGCERAFESVDNDIDYVINLAAETRKGQTEPVYKDGIQKLTSNVCQFVHTKFGNRLKCYMEVSTGFLYPSDKTPHKESDKVDLWNHEVKYKYEAEKEVANVLKNYIIIRPAQVYGIGDRNGITPRLVTTAIYKHLNETMKLPWTADVRVNTVHVDDLVKTIYHLCLYGKSGEIYNVTDKGNTTQGHLSTIMSQLFKTQHEFLGTTLSTIAKLDMKDVIEDINDKHMGPWANLCATSGVENTPLSPYIYPETALIYKRNLSLDGSKITNATNFDDFSFPSVTKGTLAPIVRDFIELGLFPKMELCYE